MTGARLARKHSTEMRLRFLTLAFALLTLPHVASAQIVQLGSSGEVRERFKDLPASPTPRGPDGKVIIGTLPGEIGLWLPNSGATERLVNPDILTPEGT